MGEYYSDEEIDAILNNHALIRENINEAIRYAKSVEKELAALRHENDNLNQKYESLYFYAKEMYTVLVNEIGQTRMSEEFKNIFINDGQ